MYIEKLGIKKIHNSRKELTLEVTVLFKGKKFKTSAPSGASVGRHEINSWAKRGLAQSAILLKKIETKLKNINFQTFEDLIYVERLIKPSILGGNAMFALQSSILKALASSQGKELWQFLSNSKKIPRPLGNCIGGGLHSKEKVKPEFQEFLLLPKEKNFADNYAINYRVYYEIKKALRAVKLSDEKAFATNYSNERVLSLLNKIRSNLNKRFKKTFDIGLDIAANSFYKNGMYRYRDKLLTRERQIKYI
ncbi:MAG: hypothetical protein ABH817_00095, partial [archaeon]